MIDSRHDNITGDYSFVDAIVGSSMKCEIHYSIIGGESVLCSMMAVDTKGWSISMGSLAAISRQINKHYDLFPLQLRWIELLIEQHRLDGGVRDVFCDVRRVE